MNFSIERSVMILSRTPSVFKTMISGLPEEWTSTNEGPETWSPRDVVAHLIHCEETDWMPRMDTILSAAGDKRFSPFDPAGHEKMKHKSLPVLLDEFAVIRDRNINYMLSKQLGESDLERKGIHPAFGEVTLSQLLATWTVHDLNHISQAVRVMAKQYKDEVGPWTQYLRILKP